MTSQSEELLDENEYESYRLYEPSEYVSGFLKQNSMTYVFVSFRAPCMLVSLWGTPISPARNITKSWILARLFEYSSYFISSILYFICWMVLMMVSQWKPAIVTNQIKLHLALYSKKKCVLFSLSVVFEQCIIAIGKYNWTEPDFVKDFSWRRLRKFFGRITELGCHDEK